MNRVQVVPLTRRIDRLYPSEAFVSLRGARSKAMADQLTTASKNRLLRREGALSASDLQALEDAIRVQLGL